MRSEKLCCGGLTKQILVLGKTKSRNIYYLYLLFVSLFLVGNEYLLVCIKCILVFFDKQAFSVGKEDVKWGYSFTNVLFNYGRIKCILVTKAELAFPNNHMGPQAGIKQRTQKVFLTLRCSRIYIGPIYSSLEWPPDLTNSENHGYIYRKQLCNMIVHV